jgi:hypothetical protein
MGKYFTDPKSSEILSNFQIALFWPKLLPALFLNSLMPHTGLTRFPLLSTVADTEFTRCDRYPHVKIVHAMLNTVDSIEATSITSGKNY